MTDPRRLHPDHAPTPFSADQIRDASPDGHTVETVTEVDGAVLARQRITFLATTDTTTTMRAATIDETGTEIGERREQEVAWVELQAHASFPADSTTITDEIIETAMGTLPCRRYVVAGPDATTTFWFATDHPGMPVRYTTDTPGAATTSVVSIGRR